MFFRVQILNNDAKGECKGTLYSVTAYFNSKQYYLEWTVLDELHNTLAYRAYCDLYNQYQSFVQTYYQNQEALLKASKAESLLKRKEAVTLKPESMVVLDSILASETSLVTQYLDGKEKALNALVGKTIKLLRDSSLEENPFDITQVLKGKLHQ